MNSTLNRYSNPNQTQSNSSTLIDGLMQPQCYDHPVTELRLIETHISWVILTGSFVYKIKKPIALDFLDFSSLEKRHFYCQQEIRLNQRLAPEIYLQVVTISGTSKNPVINGEGEVIEYAVKMRQFPQASQLDRMLEHGDLKTSHIDAFADLIANFHQTNNIAGSNVKFGEPMNLLRPVEENFTMLEEHINDKQLIEKLKKLQAWSETAASDLQAVFKQRKQYGYIRECHGDLHLRNMAWVNDKPLLFDCIEFDDNLIWIDVISEVAFLYMDLHKNECQQLAFRFLNHYLELTGDYVGVTVLPFYLSYRALVRAKIASIQAEQLGQYSERQAEAEKTFQQYLLLAENYTKKTSPQLIITHGFSACGKTTISQKLLEQMGVIRIRSDVERKRLFGMQTEKNASADIGKAIYNSKSNKKTYDKLLELAGVILDSGFSVIVDATFLEFSQRKRFQNLASVKRVPYIILDITAQVSSLRQRIEQREKGASDATRAVLEYQLNNSEQLRDGENSHVVVIDTEIALNVGSLLKKISSFRI